jgi:type II secretory ATPase GspE/PulE/Tfp pilus assembly ATPase PilB-like protein
MIMRLPSTSKVPPLSELGFSDYNYKVAQRLFGYANGLTLFAGPMGAGKTTSMYSALNLLGGANKAVYSVEDPIERFLEHVEQIEVAEDAGNTYASILRSLRRADLEVLLLGEIRDRDTSMAAIQISIAGARVISSIHANDSVGALEAMVTLSGAPPLQVLQSLRGVVSQRLISLICQSCNKAGCKECMGTGYLGRAPIHEVLHVTSELAAGVVQNKPRDELIKLARSQGMKTLREDAERLLTSGRTDENALIEVLGNNE